MSKEKRWLVDFEDYNGIIKGEVVGCDPDIGITIVDADNKNIHLLCVNMPLSPLWEKVTNPDKERAKEIYEFIEKQIKLGIIKIKDAERIFNEPGDTGYRASAKSCPFGQ